MTRADLKHCGKNPDAREELNRSVREGIIESRHSIKSLEGMGSSSHEFTYYTDTEPEAANFANACLKSCDELPIII